MADDQVSTDAAFWQITGTLDAQGLVVRAVAAELGYDEISDHPRKGTWLHRVVELRTAYDAGELTNDQFRDAVRSLRTQRDALPES